MSTDLPVIVIGAGPVGLAAAAHLVERGLPFQVVEAGDQPGAAVRAWGHVRIFSPWRYNLDEAAARLLTEAGWSAPDPDALPTGHDLVDAYLAPLAKLPEIAPYVEYHAQVTGISRLGLDRVRSRGREDAPFVVQLADGRDLHARAIIDASGTWQTPNVLGANGLPARGETDPAISSVIDHALPDVLGADRERHAGHHTLVIGAGHSAANTLLSLAELADQAPGTRVTWAIRAATAQRTYGGGAADELPARGALGTRLRAHVDAGRITVLTGFAANAVRPVDGALEVSSLDERALVVDRIVSATGFRPDHTITGELRLDLDPILGSTRALAPLIDPNEHSCGTVPPHGVDQLSHPEPGYYAVGMKSYGRAPTFLMATGYEQVRSVVAALAGDWDAARQVHLTLPETGVCNSNASADQADSCCDSAPATGRGLATGIEGGLLATPLPLVTLAKASDEQTTGGCCG